jgi:hypothetical protein
MRHLALFLLLAACGGESAASLAEAHRAAGTAKLAKIAALAPLVAAQPLLTADAWQLPPGERLDFVAFTGNLTKEGKREPNPTYNAAIAYEDHLAKPATAENMSWQHGKDLFLLMCDSSDEWLIGTACLFETGLGRYGSEPVVYNLESGLSALERMKYLLVLRLRTRQPPNLVMSELQAGQMKSFEGGRVAGDAVLYDVEHGTMLGGFTVDAGSDAEVEVRNSRVHDQLQLKLAANANEQIKSKLALVGTPPR